jgi:aryl-alcohol dehydrogenase-like predicted oxidoreductase
MDARTLGESGILVSVLGLGCNNFGFLDQAVTDEVVGAAIDRGVTLFDTADYYGRGQSESQLGRALRGRRAQVVIATKFGQPMDDAGLMGGASARYIAEACEASLRRLGTDWIDLYQLHKPDPAVPLEETMEALQRLVSAGKVRAIGCSNLPAADLRKANGAAADRDGAPFVCAQDNYSLLYRRMELDLFPELERQRMGFLPYLPLAGGMLTGKYHRGAPAPDGTRMSRFKAMADAYMVDRVWSVVEALEAVARARGWSLLELALGWLAAQPQVTSVIAGATSLAQVEANVAAVGLSPSSADLKAIEELTSPGRQGRHAAGA